MSTSQNMVQIDVEAGIEVEGLSETSIKIPKRTQITIRKVMRSKLKAGGEGKDLTFSLAPLKKDDRPY